MKQWCSGLKSSYAIGRLMNNWNILPRALISNKNNIIHTWLKSAHVLAILLRVLLIRGVKNKHIIINLGKFKNNINICTYIKKTLTRHLILIMYRSSNKIAKQWLKYLNPQDSLGFLIAKIINVNIFRLTKSAAQFLNKFKQKAN